MGYAYPEEARLDRFGPKVPPSAAWATLFAWWLKHPGNTPNWDIALSCDVTSWVLRGQRINDPLSIVMMHDDHCRLHTASWRAISAADAILTSPNSGAVWSMARYDDRSCTHRPGR